MLLVAAGALIAPAAVAQVAPAGTAQPGAAQPATSGSATPTVGAQIHDAAGLPVGTVDSITAQAVVVNTGTNKVGLPANAIGSDGKGGFVSSLTKVQLDAAYQQQAAQAGAQLKTKLVAGAAVSSADGTALGTIKSVDEQYVTLTTAKGDVQLPATVFALDASGNVAAQMTAAQFQAAVSQVKPATAK
jgi:hypothetical protein